MSHALGDVSVKILLNGISEIFLPMFSSRTFMVLWLIFKSFIHLEFIFVCSVSWWFEFHFFACSCLDLPTPFVEEAIFTPFYVPAPLCQILIDHRDIGLFLGSLFCSIGLCVCSYASTRLFWLQWPYNIVWYQVLWSLLCQIPCMLLLSSLIPVWFCFICKNYLRRLFSYL